MAAAQICACEFAADAERGMAPAMAASPMTWMLGWSLERNVTGSTGHQPVRSATPASSARRPAFCGGMMLATAALYLSKSVASVRVATSTEVSAPPFGDRNPFDHAGIELLPGRLEQPLHGEAVLGVEHDHLGARLFGLEIVRDQAGALVGRRRTARRIDRRGDHHGAAVGHGFKLPAQQRDLLAVVEGVRHAGGGGVVVARDGVPAEIDAGRDHQPVVGELRAVGERHRACLRIDRGRRRRAPPRRRRLSPS